jgi:hypothetical protein
MAINRSHYRGGSGAAAGAQGLTRGPLCAGAIESEVVTMGIRTCWTQA